MLPSLRDASIDERVEAIRRSDMKAVIKCVAPYADDEMNLPVRDVAEAILKAMAARDE